MRIVLALEDAEFLLKTQPDKDPLNAKDKESLQQIISDLEMIQLEKIHN
jgi:hypothetical protein